MGILVAMSTVGVIAWLIIQQISADNQAERLAVKKRREAFWQTMRENEARWGYPAEFIWQVVQVAADDLEKLGLTSREEDAKLLLVRSSDGTVHFYVESETPQPQYQLMVIQYQGRYEHTTAGTINGRTGSALVGAAIAGNVGATIGSAQARAFESTTTDTEIASYGLLDLTPVAGGAPIAISVLMDQAIYQTLYKDYLWRPEAPAATAELDPKLVAHLHALHDQGVLTDQEFAEKLQVAAGLLL